jgi:FtsH-binding integral membrane protein
MKLIAYYLALSLVANVVVALFCLTIEEVLPAISMPLFLGMFFISLWGCWVIAVRMTEPKAASAPLAGATSDQRA